MLSTVYAAETQFRLDSARIARDLKHLASIRERSALSAPSPRLVAAAIAQSVPAPAVRATRTWPRPIGMAHPEPACA